MKDYFFLPLFLTIIYLLLCLINMEMDYQETDLVFLKKSS